MTFHDSAKLRHCDNDWKITFSVDGRRIANYVYDRRVTDCVVKTMEFAECGEVMKGNLRFTTLVSPRISRLALEMADKSREQPTLTKKSRLEWRI